MVLFSYGQSQGTFQPITVRYPMHCFTRSDYYSSWYHSSSSVNYPGEEVSYVESSGISIITQ